MKIDLSKIDLTDVSKIISILSKAGQTRLVGGVVREILMDHVPKDIDLATQVLPNVAMELLEAEGIKVVPTGIKFGTVMALVGDAQYEITTLRSDIKSNGRHAEVVYTNDWKIDSDRRDFTINAMYADLDGNLYDFHDGISDITERRIRFIGNAHERIAEDHLRILRFFRFYGYYTGAIYDEGAFRACCEDIRLLSNLSGERVRDELFKILTLKDANQVMRLMQKARVLDNIFDAEMMYPDFWVQTTDPIVALAYILLESNVGIERVKRLKLSNKQARELRTLMENYNKFNFEKEQLKYVYHFGFEMLLRQLELASLLSHQTIKSIDRPHTMPKFPVRSQDLIGLGYQGKELGNKMRELESMWINSDFSLSKNELLK